MGLEYGTYAETLRKARDAEAVHLEAALKVNGAKALRLAHLVSLLRERLKENPSVLDGIELQTAPGSEPQLWLDLVHRMTLEPDAKTYCLSALADGRREELLTTTNLEEALDTATRVLAHKQIAQTWQRAESARKTTLWSLSTLVYVWFTGVVAGAAGLALYYIYLK